LVGVQGAPRRLRLDNGPEFISAALKAWAHRHGVELLHIQPGKPTQNAYIERFNRTFRTEVLDRYVFTSLDEIRRMTEDWRYRYKHHRPHRSLAGWPVASRQSPVASRQSPSLGHNHRQPLLLADSKKRGRFKSCRRNPSKHPGQTYIRVKYQAATRAGTKDATFSNLRVELFMPPND
jgi:hypothetical protein